MRVITRLVATTMLLFAGFGADPCWAKDVVVHAGRLIDGMSPKPSERMSILIHDDRIVGVQKGFVTWGAALIIDLSTSTVLPGLIDCHHHLTQVPGLNPLDRFYRTTGDGMIDAVVNARIKLSWGFTTLRDVGSDLYAGPALKRAIEAGKIPGPRIWTAMQPLSGTGAHSDILNGLPPGFDLPDSQSYLVDGPVEGTRQVRLHHRNGATLIKIMPSGGVGTVGTDPNVVTMTDDEMKAIVETAHSLNMKVAAHAIGKRAIDHAILAGVDSIEHGVFADNESYALMKSHGTFLVSTLLTGDWVYQVALHHPETLPPGVAAKALAVVPAMQTNIGRAYRAGVKIAFGTDISAQSDRMAAEEFALLVKAGLPSMAAITAATRTAAELIGDEADIGSIQAGRYADIIAVKGDPLTDITELQRITFVMKGGAVYKSGGRMLQ